MRGPGGRCKETSTFAPENLSQRNLCNAFTTDEQRGAAPIEPIGGHSKNPSASD